MFLRLVVNRRDEDSSRKQGVFSPAYELFWGGTLPEADHERLGALISWFERNLPPPDRSKLEPRAIFWFKQSSDRLFRKLWDVAAILREHDFHVEKLKTSRPGYIRYEDAYQVGATPFRDARID